MTDSDSVLVVFTPSGRRGRFPVGTLVLDAARTLGVDIDGVCGGKGRCGRCQVDVRIDGQSGITPALARLTGKGANEAAWELRHGPLPEGRRFSCSSQLLGDLVVDVPPFSQLLPATIRKAFDGSGIEVDPLVRLYTVTVPPPNPNSPASDISRLRNVLSHDCQLHDLRIELDVIQQLPALLSKRSREVTLAVRDQRQVMAIWPGVHKQVYGVAVDVGSTSLAAHLCDLVSGEILAASGRMNPQIRFGEDLMSRLSYIMLHEGGEQSLTRSVRDALNEMVAELATSAGIDTRNIMEVCLVGNPIMHSLVFGINPVGLGLAPFTLVCDEAFDNIGARMLGLDCHAHARAYGLPSIAGHVGADTAGAILAEAPYLDEGITLLVDIGTNAEIVLGNRHRLLATSSPTGPAFEGAQISAGQRATPGAIERIRIDPITAEPRFKVIGCDYWSDESGFQASINHCGVTGICGSGIIEAIGELFLVGIVRPDGTVNNDWVGRSTRMLADGRTYSYQLYQDKNKSLTITQNDIRAIQLAKAALYASIKLLQEQLGTNRVDRIKLAGAFGSHIDVRYALLLGLIPDCDIGRISSVGNAAGRGACMALLNVGARRKVEAIVRTIEKIETATEARFQQHFIEAMAIPHQVDPFDNLSRQVGLPRAEFTSTRSRRRSRH